MQIAQSLFGCHRSILVKAARLSSICAMMKDLLEQSAMRVSMYGKGRFPDSRDQLANEFLTYGLL